MANVLWNENPTGESLIATSGALKNLANNGIAISGEIANGTDKKRFASIELYLHDFAAAPSAGGYFECHIVYQLDGTAYCDGEDGDLAGTPNLTGNTQVGSFSVKASDEDQWMQLVGIPIYPFDFKVCFVNKCGQAIANTDGSFAKIYRFTEAT